MFLRILSRPGFCIIALLIAAMLLLTLWMQWKLDTLSGRDPKQESTPAAVTNTP